MNEGLVDKILNAMSEAHNDFKTTQDRKYGIYTIFRSHDNSTPFKVEKLEGSNQVLLYDNNGETIYNSDLETYEQQNDFRTWLRKQIIILLLCILPEGLNDTKGT